MADFVLVHGGWHGGWCYDGVAERLRRSGHRVWAPSLIGLAERASLVTPDICLSTHVAEIARLIQENQLQDIVLCGHSYGGMVVEGVADLVPNRIAALVFLDAIVAEHGQTLFEAVGPKLAGVMQAQALPDRPWLMAPLPPAAFGLTGADAALVEARCTPHPIACFAEPLSLSGASAEMRRRVFCLPTGFLNPFNAGTAARLRSLPDWTVVELPGSHDMMVDQPDSTASLLDRTARLVG